MANIFTVARFAVGSIFIATSCLAYAMHSEYIVVNRTTSVEPGIYLRTPAPSASHVTFCLTQDHKALGFYSRFCSPQSPTSTRILKAVEIRKQNGDLIVKGKGVRPIDSHILGPITKMQVVEYYRMLIPLSSVRDIIGGPARQTFRTILTKHHRKALS